MRFRIVVMHDAEDLIHPDSLRLINWFSRRYAMVQVPVLPLPTAVARVDPRVVLRRIRRIPAQRHSGSPALGRLPSIQRGGHGLRSRSAGASGRYACGRPFDPACLTEDYETGYLLHSLGYRQIFLPVRSGRGRTGGYPRILSAPSAAGDFATHPVGHRHRPAELAAPRLARSAGRQLYWFWRDRKGLVGNLLSPVPTCSSFTARSVICVSRGTPGAGTSGGLLPDWISDLCRLTFGIALLQTGVRSRLRRRHLWLALRRRRPAAHVLGQPGKFCRYSHRPMGILGVRMTRAYNSSGARQTTCTPSRSLPWLRAWFGFIR